MGEFKPICESCQFFSKNGACEKHPKGYPKAEVDRWGVCQDFELKEGIGKAETELWRCERCGEEIEWQKGKRPAFCMNPNCGARQFRKIMRGELEERSELKELKKISDEERTAVTCELGPEELKKILGLTIKRDDINKLVHFIGAVLTYTEGSQLNISNRGPSSIGKSYLPIEIATLYLPMTDQILIAYCSPTAFFHEVGEWDDEIKSYRVNLERKILVFLDQPHDELLRRLRPLLSHDRRELLLKITDKREKKGMRTKNVIIRGFPTVFFCTGSLRVDEQEATRNVILSPETSVEKIRESVFLRALRAGNPIAYNELLNANIGRKRLRQRMLLIKHAGVKQVIIRDPQSVAERFVKQYQKLKPRHARDIERVIALAKGWALLNLWHRERDGDGNLYAAEQDIDRAFDLYHEIAECQELGIPPYLFQLFKEIIEPLYWEKYRETRSGVVSTADENNREKECVVSATGLERKDVIYRHFEVYGRPLADWFLRREILPALESAGLIMIDEDPNDRRKKLIYVPTPPPSSLYLGDLGEEKEKSPPIFICRFLADTMEPLEVDGSTYGPFTQGSIVPLPEPVAKVLHERGVARIARCER